MPYGTINADLMTTSDGVSAAGLYGMKNRILNGDMRIDQRNAGASITPTAVTFSVDRWGCSLTQASKFSVQQNAGSVTPPTGYSKYLGATSLSAYSVLTADAFYFYQGIEGFNMADMAWGTASAATVTLSFWVRSSLTGTFGGSLTNGTRSYPFTYTISAANTWEKETITIVGDTSGTWATNNAVGVYVILSIGTGTTQSGTAGSWSTNFYASATGATSVVGTNGATFYITGVQLEKGSTATSFDYLDYGRSLAQCQRYYFKIQATGDFQPFGAGYNSSTTVATGYTAFPVPLRTRPTALEQSGTAANYKVRHGATETVCSSVPTFSTSTDVSANTNFTVASGLTAGQGSMIWSGSSSAYLAWSAEL